MSGALPIPVRSLSVMAAVLVATLSAICFLDAARAEDCLAAPNGPAPQGSHWYYRIDRAKQRKCWYVHAIMTSAARTGELPRASATAPVVDSKLPAAAPAQSADLPPDVPLAASDADAAAHVTILSVKPKPAPVVSATPNSAGQFDASGAGTISADPRFAPPNQSAEFGDPRDFAGAHAMAPADATGAAIPGDAATLGAEPADPNDAAELSANPASRGRGVPLSQAASTDTSSLTPTELFLVLVTGLAIAGFVTRIVVKIANARRRPFVVDDWGWRDESEQQPWPAQTEDEHDHQPQSASYDPLSECHNHQRSARVPLSRGFQAKVEAITDLPGESMRRAARPEYAMADAAPSVRRADDADIVEQIVERARRHRVA